MTRWLLDQGLPRSCATMLRDLGHDAVHVGEIGMSAATDHEIITHAEHDNRVIITLDADFHAILACGSARLPSVVRIREEGMKGSELCRLVLRIETQFEASLAA